MQLIQCFSPTAAGVAIFPLSCHHRRIDLLLHVIRRQCCIRQHRAAPPRLLFVPFTEQISASTQHPQQIE